MANKRNGTIYIDVTSNLVQRVYQHREGQVEGFTKQYDCKMLVYYELYEDMETAIVREKVLKGWVRKKKLARIESVNPQWNDLWDDIASF